jgi:hypothetical protein
VPTPAGKRTNKHCFNGHSILHHLLHQTFVGFAVVTLLRLRLGFSFLGVASSSSLPFPLFFAGIVSGGGIEVEVDAAVERVTPVLSCRDVPEDASSRGTNCFTASMAAEASCGASAIEGVEVYAAVD